MWATHRACQLTLPTRRSRAPDSASSITTRETPSLRWFAHAGPRTCFPRHMPLAFPRVVGGPPGAILLLYPGAFQSKLRAVDCARLFVAS
ncbi:hypothetical protein PAXRUDRAFT_387320 [Paxillus rubicundulus Ve08.2h10]|uniref:Uncharacterized protein n=1 Tax=Paxillus rubicundulus Ve08.2h10 TaxID=930991 RepID=A0A0D0D190_9AGAM|nr:hypothetical protein PAXRUDRAFT_387320 [Paxillus rubicundulus Ve08.2h10]